MHIHILGICGTFMGGLAVIARQLGHTVTGSDAGVYPPMSTLLEEQGIVLNEGYKAAHLQPVPDLIVVGNAMTRGNPAIEYMLDNHLPYTSGPQWLSEHVLQSRRVLAVAGTHGKTTTASLLAHLFEACGQSPGFLIGGVPLNFGVSARIGDSDWFVIEADEYDSAFFDKRSKFVHYRPTFALLNNLEFDHADIFDDLAAIRRQFHHLVRTIPGNGQIVVNAREHELRKVLDMGCWSHVNWFYDATTGSTIERADIITTGDESNPVWSAIARRDDYSRFTVLRDGKSIGDVEWPVIGAHNMMNALGAAVMANQAGLDITTVLDAMSGFIPPKRRLELKADTDDIMVFDDFAHHPTAITGTLAALRAKYPQNRLIAVFEPRSNTMKMGTHQNDLKKAMSGADLGFLLQPESLSWSLPDSPSLHLIGNTTALYTAVIEALRPGDRVCVMSNGSFDGMSDRLAAAVLARN